MAEAVDMAKEVKEPKKPEKELFEVPDSVRDELKRLHQVLLNETIHDSYREWARDKINQIHMVYFNGKIYYENEP